MMNVDWRVSDGSSVLLNRARELVGDKHSVRVLF